MLDKELQAITKGTEHGKRLLDKLFKVSLKDGQQQLILVHIEVQNKPEEEFPKRMLSYSYRIYDKYELPVASCAILTDTKKNWRPNHFEVGIAGSYLRSEFLVIKLIDYAAKKSTLERVANPFASVILSQLEAIETKSKAPGIRKDIKFALTKRLYNKGFNKAQVTSLYIFIDWLIGLPNEFELEYLNDVYKFEESNKMSYITSAERLKKELSHRIWSSGRN